MLIWILVIVFLSIIFFCTLSSVALNAIPIERLWRLREGGGRSARGVDYWVTHSQQITWACRVASRISCVALALVLATLIEGEPLPLYAFIIALLVTTVLVAFPGSLLPSAWAQLAGEKIGLSLLPFIRVLGVILTPIGVGCYAILSAILKPFGIAALKFKPLSLRSEIEQCVGGLEKSTAISDAEKKMVRRIFAFGGLEATEIMTPRIFMRCLSEDEPVARAIELIKVERLSRIPIFRKSPDRVVGVLYAKDLLARWGEKGLEERAVGEFAREPLFVPGTSKLPALFSEMCRKRIHMAIIVDEYGSAIGLATLENVIEEIVGEIRDEHDFPGDMPYKKVGEGVYEVDAYLSVHDARRELGVAIPERPEYDTLAGFICAVYGAVPAAGEVITLEGDSYKVLKATKRGVTRLEIRTDKSQRGSDARIQKPESRSQ
jgi:CBS domain containing-hemolysin-like protein